MGLHDAGRTLRETLLPVGHGLPLTLYSPTLWSSAGWLWTPDHANDRHHAFILVLQNVAVVHEIADIRTAEIQAQRNAGIGMSRIAIPMRDINRVQQLALKDCYRLAAIHLEVILRGHQEMHLVHVELVVLLTAVFDDPFLYRA